MAGESAFITLLMKGVGVKGPVVSVWCWGGGGRGACVDGCAYS